LSDEEDFERLRHHVAAALEYSGDTHKIEEYFSRAGIPFPRASGTITPLQHVGLYAYRRSFLSTFPTLERTPLEQTESLEQLRALEHGYRIRVVHTSHVPESVDTADDLERVRALFSEE
jgi:3-deoxy-manno-octulosonate cytidylyltransferase (CMP-KDO synthetase)